MSTFGPDSSCFGGTGSTFGELTACDPSLIPITIAAYSRGASGSAALATFSNSGQRKWRDPLNEAGAGSFVLPNGDADLAACEFGNIITFSHRTVPRWSMFVRRHERLSRAPGEEHDQITVVSGLGLESVLEEAVVYPQNGAGNIPFYDVRYFNFAVPEYDDSTWIAPTEVPAQPFFNPPNASYQRARPTGFPNTTAVGIWSSPMPANDVQPGAFGYFRGEFTLTEAVQAKVYLAGDDTYELWIDGLLMFQYLDPSGTGWWEGQSFDVTLSAGTHLIAARVVCGAFDAYGDTIILSAGPWDPPPGHYNVGELLVAVYSIDITTGTNVDLLFETNLTDWVVFEQDPATMEPPGFTPGEVVNVLMDEAQARGALVDVTRTWTDDLDSNGTPWPLTADITFRVGINYYGVLRQLTEGYLDFDFAADALEMSLWTARGTDVSGTAQLAGGVNLGSLKHTREG